MSDRQIKSALWAMILLGLVLGGIWGQCLYGLADPRSWNLMGIAVITTVAGYAGVYALAGFLKDRRAAR